LGRTHIHLGGILPVNTHAVVFVAVVLSLFASASPKETVACIISSDDTLIAEQAAIYSFVLREEVKFRKSDKVLLLADGTVPFEHISDEKIESIQRREDLKGIAFKRAKEKYSLQQLDKSLMSDLNIRLVNPNTYLPSGVLTLSEILFDKEHLYAVVAYEFYRGPLAAHGSTMVLKKIDGHWKVHGPISAWVS
jgi:hypothetical protein